MEENKQYIVKGPRGYYSLDEGAYRDYLAGKLWITWMPGKPKTDAPSGGPVLPNVSQEVRELYEQAKQRGALAVLKAEFPGRTVAAPYKSRMADIRIEELNLTVRAYNGLRRSHADTLGRLKELADSEGGLGRIRSVGAKSVEDISNAFFEDTYNRLTSYEKAEFWQTVLDNKTGDGF